MRSGSSQDTTWTFGGAVERIESIYTFASNILRIKGSKGQWSGERCAKPACDASSENDGEKRRSPQSDRQSFQTELIKKFFFTKIAGFDQGARKKPNDYRAEDHVIRDG